MDETTAANTCWRGKPLTECTREELIEAVLYLAAELRPYRTPEVIDALARAELERFRSERGRARV